MTKDLNEKAGTEGREEDAASDYVVDFCRELIGRLGLTLDLEVHEEQERVIAVNLSGPDRALLLTNTASVLNNIEYLLNKVFQTGKDEEIATIVVDSDSYRKQREAELNLLAQIASKKVLAQRRPLSLQPMTPRERRIVHIALASITGVRSQSDGEGENRNITIYPV